MTEPWLAVVGIGEDGIDGLRPAARAALESAEVIIGAERHHRLSDRITAQRIAWPSPFDALLDVIRGLRGRRVVVLATGDPLWYSVGARIARAFPGPEVVFHPQVSAFQWAACRLGWSLADLETLTAHGRPVAQIAPFVQPGARLLVLTTGADTPAEVAELLVSLGYGPSRMTVFGHLGGPEESRFDGTAAGWSARVPDFNTLAVECVAGPEAVIASTCPGLDDALFVHDGLMTKREVRAAALAKLMPMRGALLWDVGAGSGAVGIEWMRAARDALAIGIEPRADRRALAAANAVRLGAPRLRLVDGTAPDALAELERPDAVFLGGGLSAETVDRAYAALKPMGRLVAHAVTFESELVLSEAWRRHGGDLVRIAVERVGSVGRMHGWRPSMAVTQWSLIKR
ncbi:MAG: precorrin-6y C5,15-methyltransferase (decarboxylating) subunit CbiE [Alphaproteobacteria bacterium]|nr:MAG: precorrin-6y C5,15-methyltransferase (decarboxylating) subunit CbiE [Alphaproteobacteria bacterium]